MKNKLLLACIIGFMSITSVYAACYPTWGTKDKPCECAYPILDSNGSISCGTSYCGIKKCMKDGSCCETPNNARTECCDKKGNGVANDDTCCPALESPDCETETDNATGCLQCKDDGTCANGEGIKIQTVGSGTFCVTLDSMTWYDAKSWCEKHDMTMPTIYDMCPNFDGNIGGGKCPEMNLTDGSGGDYWSATLNPNNTNDTAFWVDVFGGTVLDWGRDNPMDPRAICRK